jgi:RNA polymerase sigma-B factor
MSLDVELGERLLRARVRAGQVCARTATLADENRRQLERRHVLVAERRHQRDLLVALVTLPDRSSRRWRLESGAEEQRRIWQLHVAYARTRDRATRAELVENYAEFAHRIARRAGTSPDVSEDLGQVAMEGLLIALERFDPIRRTPFPAYAHATIFGLVCRHRRASAHVIGVPTRVDAKLRAVSEVAAQLTQELTREPTVLELADRAGLPPEEVANLRLAERAGHSQPMNGDAPFLGVESSFEDVDARIDLTRALATLSATDRAMIEAYFWLGLTQSAIAAQVGASQMTVSRRLAGIVQRLRRGCN